MSTAPALTEGVFAVTGATGHLGRLTVEALIARGVPADSIVGVVRTAAKAADLAEKGVQLRSAAYEDPAALRAAFEGVDALLFVSGSEVGARVAQHTNIAAAAVAAGVGRIAYTSLLRADTSPMRMAEEHLATERILADTGIPVTMLRNGWYWENFAASVPAALEYSTLVGAAGDGRIAGAARRDYADAAAVVLTSDGHAGRVYELGGDEHLGYADLARIIGAAAGREVAYKKISEAEYAGILSSAGVPATAAEVLADADASVGKGALDTESTVLRELTGHASTPAAEVLGAAVAEALA